jgi:hypothetical protein
MTRRRFSALIESAMPKPVLQAIPRTWRPVEIATKIQRKRTNTRIWWNYTSRREIELYGGARGAFGLICRFLFKTPIEHYLAMPSSDPNRFLRDPYALRKLSEKIDEHEAEIQQRIAHQAEGGDELSRTLANYTHSRGLK